MPGLTVTEKSHWRDRIAKRIDRKIEAVSAEEPNLLDRIEQEARQRALESLGLANLQTELDEIDRHKEALESRERQARLTMLAKVRGVPLESLAEYFCQRDDQEIERAIQRRQAVYEEQLLGENATGHKILELRREKDGLLDTVWLATSPAQIKVLWFKVAELLGDDQTRLQIEALAIVPPSDN
jgi:hypothetical protein